MRPGGAGGHRDEELDRAAARGFSPVEGAVVVHVHTDPVTGLLAAARPGQMEEAAAVLARRGVRPVLAASADVFTMAGSQLVTARWGFGDDGRPVVDADDPGSWVLFGPGGTEPVVFGRADGARGRAGRRLPR